MWHIVVFQPFKCQKTHFQPQIWSIWPIFPNDSESLPKVCYIKRKSSEILSKCRNSESAGGSGVQMWSLRLPAVVQESLQCEQLYSFSPEWISMCVLKWEDRVGMITLFRTERFFSGMNHREGRGCWGRVITTCARTIMNQNMFFSSNCQVYRLCSCIGCKWRTSFCHSKAPWDGWQSCLFPHSCFFKPGIF